MTRPSISIKQHSCYQELIFRLLSVYFFLIYCLCWELHMILKCWLFIKLVYFPYFLIFIKYPFGVFKYFPILSFSHKKFMFFKQIPFLHAKYKYLVEFWTEQKKGNTHESWSLSLKFGLQLLIGKYLSLKPCLPQPAT